MNKQEFLRQLRTVLSGLPQDEIEERATFYSEMIDDRMEEGLSESEAVAAVGSIEEIYGQIVAEIPLSKIAAARIKPRREFSPWEIVLLILGFPLWFSLLVAAVSVIFSLYVTLWSVVISLWAVFTSLAACAFGCVAACFVFVFSGHTLSGLALLAAGIFLAGISIFAFFGCKAATRGTVLLTKKTVLGIKHCFIRKEALL